jgi:hypothetical protein
MLALAQLIAGNSDSAPDPSVVLLTERALQPRATKALEVVQSLFEVEIGEVIGDQLVAQEGGELFVLVQEGVLEVGAEDMMPFSMRSMMVVSLPCILR